MKLPQNKKERIQVLALIVIGALLAIFALAQLAVLPFIASRQKLKSALAEQELKLEKAKRELHNFAPSVRVDHDRVTGEIDAIIAAHVLRPILGSYLVGVTETIEKAAQAAGLKVAEIQEVGVRELPTKKAAANVSFFKSYAVHTTAEGTYGQVLTFLDAIETENPYLCVTDIGISGRPDRPELHRITVRIEWPIQAAPEASGDPSAEKKGGAP